MCFKLPGAPGQSSPLRLLGLRSGFEPSGLDRPGRLPHQQGLCEARLGYRDRSPQGGPGPDTHTHTQTQTHTHTHPYS